jgi:hypothetical protein
MSTNKGKEAADEQGVSSSNKQTTPPVTSEDIPPTAKVTSQLVRRLAK